MTLLCMMEAPAELKHSIFLVLSNQPGSVEGPPDECPTRGIHSFEYGYVPRVEAVVPRVSRRSPVGSLFDDRHKLLAVHSVDVVTGGNGGCCRLQRMTQRIQQVDDHLLPDGAERMLWSEVVRKVSVVEKDRSHGIATIVGTGKGRECSFSPRKDDPNLIVFESVINTCFPARTIVKTFVRKQLSDTSHGALVRTLLAQRREQKWAVDVPHP